MRYRDWELDGYSTYESVLSSAGCVESRILSHLSWGALVRNRALTVYTYCSKNIRRKKNSVSLETKRKK